MTEFRKFCCGYFGFAGLVAAAHNHGFHLEPQFETPAGMIAIAFVGGCLTVAIFGDRK